MRTRFTYATYGYDFILIHHMGDCTRVTYYLVATLFPDIYITLHIYAHLFLFYSVTKKIASI